MVDIRYWLWLSLALNPNFKHTNKILSAFADAKEVYTADAEKLSGAGLSEEMCTRLCDKSVKQTKEVFSFCREQGIKLIAYDSPEYPERLRKISNPPILLYCMGDMPDIDDNVCIATVGTRKITEYGRREAYTLTFDLSVAGAVIVSGMARGIDTVCHNACLDAYGTTVAVLGSGIDVIYPKENQALYEDIANHGAVITEYAPGTAPLAGNFPQRNRIISGLSLGTLVLEADSRSGALITAETALAQGRDIFSLPGKVGELNSVGTNDLIKNGAKMVTTATDVLEEYECLFPHRIRIENIKSAPVRYKMSHRHNSQPSDPKKNEGNSTPEADKVSTPITQSKPLPDTSSLDETSIKVLKKMEPGEAITPDELVDSELSISDIMVAMTILEINNFVKNLPGGKFVRN